MKYSILSILVFLLFLSCKGNNASFESNGYWEKATLEDVKKSLESGESLSKRDTRNLTALMRAVLSVSDTNILAYLLEKGADLHELRDQKRKESILALALSKNSKLDVVRFLLNRGVDPNHKTPNGLTPLMICVRNSKCTIELIELLLENGVKLEARDRFSRTAFYYAVSSSPNVEIIRFLRKKGANIKIVERYKGWSVFFAAVVSKRNEQYLKELVSWGLPYKNIVDIHGENLIVVAIRSGHSVDYIRILKNMGISPHTRTKEGVNTLMVAVSLEDVELVKQLMQWKVNYKLRDSKGRSILDYASPKFKETKLYKKIAEKL